MYLFKWRAVIYLCIIEVADSYLFIYLNDRLIYLFICLCKWRTIINAFI